MGRPQFNRKELISKILEKHHQNNYVTTLLQISSMTDEELYKFSKL